MQEDSRKRWKELVERAREALARSGQEGGDDLAALFERLHGVEGALHQMSQGTVSRQKLSEAVEASLLEILADPPEGMLPRLEELARRLEESEAEARRRVEELRSELELQPDQIVREISRQVDRQIETLTGRLEDRLEALQAMVGSLPRVLPLRGRMDRLQTRLEELEATLRGDLQKHLEGLETLGIRLETGRKNEATRQFEELQARLDAFEEALAELSCAQQSRDEKVEALRDGQGRLLEEVRATGDALRESASLPDRRASDREKVLRHLVLDLRDLLGRHLELREPDEPRPALRRLWPGRSSPPPRPEPDQEEFRYRLECLLEQIESFIVEPPEGLS